MASSQHIAVLGIFVADTSYRADRPPRMGETILGNSFALGPGGKGSNQAVAIGQLGGDVTILTRLGDDDFADMAENIWQKSGVKSAAVRDKNSYTGAAYIFVEEASGDNAIIVCPGAASDITPSDINRNAEIITNSSVFMTQLEQPVPTALHALQIAQNGGVTTILNPAPAVELDDGIYKLCDFLTPNETEASALSGINVETVDDARLAADKMLDKGVGSIVVTLGAQGALLHTKQRSEHIPAFDAGPVVETTGAGDAFNGGLATGLARGMDPIEAVRLGCATASISVTRPGTAPSMPSMEEVENLFAQAKNI